MSDNFKRSVEYLYKLYIVSEASDDLYSFDKNIKQMFDSGSLEEAEDFRFFLNTTASIFKYSMCEKLRNLGHTHINVASAISLESQIGMKWYIIDNDNGYEVRTFNDAPGQKAYVLPKQIEWVEAGGYTTVYTDSKKILALSSNLMGGNIWPRSIGQYRGGK